MGRVRLTKAEAEFARTLAGRVRWARECNGGEPFRNWPLEERLAVALVLGNRTYIRMECFSFPVAMAYAYVGKGRTHPNADLVSWINKIRDAVEGFISEAE